MNKRFSAIKIQTAIETSAEPGLCGNNNPGLFAEVSLIRWMCCYNKPHASSTATLLD